jgi:hypothetical protein
MQEPEFFTLNSVTLPPEIAIDFVTHLTRHRFQVYHLKKDIEPIQPVQDAWGASSYEYTCMECEHVKSAVLEYLEPSEYYVKDDTSSEGKGKTGTHEENYDED